MTSFHALTRSSLCPSKEAVAHLEIGPLGTWTPARRLVSLSHLTFEQPRKLFPLTQE